MSNERAKGQEMDAESTKMVANSKFRSKEMKMIKGLKKDRSGRNK